MSQDAAGHELRPADRTRIGSLDILGRAPFLARPHQQGLQFTAEKGAAVTAPAGEIKAQRGQRIQDPKAAHVPAVVGLHADDAHDQRGGHTVDPLCALEQSVVGIPEFQASLQALGLHEAAAVGRPILGRAGRWGHDELCHPRLMTGLGQDVHGVFHAPTVALGQLLGELPDVLPFTIARGGLLARGNSGVGIARGCRAVPGRAHERSQ